jgi:hypothetical protein
LEIKTIYFGGIIGNCAYLREKFGAKMWKHE